MPSMSDTASTMPPPSVLTSAAEPDCDLLETTQTPPSSASNNNTMFNITTPPTDVANSVTVTPQCESLDSPTVHVEQDLVEGNGSCKLGATEPDTVFISKTVPNDAIPPPSRLLAVELDLQSKTRTNDVGNTGTILPGAIPMASNDNHVDLDVPSAALSNLERSLGDGGVGDGKRVCNTSTMIPGAVHVEVEEPDAWTPPTSLANVERDLMLSAKMGATASGINQRVLSLPRRSSTGLPSADSSSTVTTKTTSTAPGAHAMLSGADSIPSLQHSKDPRPAALAERPRGNALANKGILPSPTAGNAAPINVDIDLSEYPSIQGKNTRTETEGEETKAHLQDMSALSSSNTKSLNKSNDETMTSVRDTMGGVDYIPSPPHRPDSINSNHAHSTTDGTTIAMDQGIAAPPFLMPGATQMPPHLVDSINSSDSRNHGLAVAVAVNEHDDIEDGDGERVTRVTAIEYDPNEKPPSLYQSRRFRLCLLIAVVVVILAIIAGVLGALLPRSSTPSPAAPLVAAAPTVAAPTVVAPTVVAAAPTAAPVPAGPTAAPTTMAPTTAAELEYLNLFARVNNNTLVFQSGTPHKLAADWIMNQDPMNLTLSSPTLIQRYILALFYFQMSDNGQKPWISCNPPQIARGNGINETIDDLCVFYQDGDLSNGVDGYNRWLNSINECYWLGITCDDNMVYILGIELRGQNLTGTLPTELTALSSLIALLLPANLISGTIPPEYYSTKFSQLIQFDLENNKLTGTFSTDWFQATNLIALNLGGNTKLSGSLTSDVGLLSNLQDLSLYDMNLTGTIPTEIGQLSSLTYSLLYQNQLHGTIPTEIGNLTALQWLYLYENRLTGSIPSQIGLVTTFTDLRLQDNLLNGIIPKQLYNLTNLSYLDLSDMNLTGTLSTKVGDLSYLEQLRINTNQLTGTVPTEMGLLSNVQLVFIFLNQFNGTIPLQFCNLRGVLQVLQADCGPADNPAQACQCCTDCCDRSTEICLTL